MIDISKLRKEDIGRWVKFANRHSFEYGPQIGRIKSWSWEIAKPGIIFVVYNCNNRWEKYYDFTAEATNPEHLNFLTLDEIIDLNKKRVAEEYEYENYEE